MVKGLHRKKGDVDELQEPLRTDVVAIVVPWYKRTLSVEERLSLAHLTKVLGKYDTYVVAPETLEFDSPAFEVKRFDNAWFESVASYSQLMLSKEVYEVFAKYKYILVYQLDCLVFSDDLPEWCRTDFDYVGAPWFRSKTDPSLGFSRVGNGGLSLRKVESFLRVIDSRRYSEQRVPYWKDVVSTSLHDVENMPVLERLLKRLRVFRDARRGVKWYATHYTLNEDHFWSDRAKLFYPEFKVAPVDVALHFSFERFPRYCYEQNNGELPFGCHGWAKWDREFWEPYLLK